MLESNRSFWKLNYLFGRTFNFIEFWVFIYFKETHIFAWSWWWLVVFQVVGCLGMLVDRIKWQNGSSK